MARVNDTNRRKLIESVLINNVDNFNINKNNLNMDTITNSIIIKLPSINKILSKIKINKETDKELHSNCEPATWQRHACCLCVCVTAVNLPALSYNS